VIAVVFFFDSPSSSDPIRYNTMQGNGFKIFLTVFFLVLSGYYLYPSGQKYFLKQEMEAMS